MSRNNGDPTADKIRDRGADIATAVVFIGLALIVLAVCAAVAWRLFDWIAP